MGEMKGENEAGTKQADKRVGEKGKRARKNKREGK